MTCLLAYIAYANGVPGMPSGTGVGDKLTFRITLAGMKRKRSQPTFYRRKPVQRRAQATVDAMLDAAVKILQRGGLSTITTNRIAETAGVSIGSVYQYFPNKHALFVALHQRHLAQVDGIVRRHLMLSENDSLDHLIGSMIDGMIEAHSVDPELSGLLQTEVPHRADGSADFATRLHEDFRSHLSLHDRTPGIRIPPSTRVFFVASMVEALGHAIILRRPRGLSLRHARQECCQAVLAYLRS
jgi:AcrR family transcriptional regulator